MLIFKNSFLSLYEKFISPSCRLSHAGQCTFGSVGHTEMVGFGKFGNLIIFTPVAVPLQSVAVISITPVGILDVAVQAEVPRVVLKDANNGH